MMRKRTNPTAGFSLVEIMIVVAIIGVLAAMAIPNFVKARETSRQKLCIENLVQIESAKQQWALDYNKGDGDLPVRSDLIGIAVYIRVLPDCPAGGTYDFKPIGTPASCTVSGHGL
jgi:prepilin-type N-terminal cleavage/methylation domain-containing protein